MVLWSSFLFPQRMEWFVGFFSSSKVGFDSLLLGVFASIFLFYFILFSFLLFFTWFLMLVRFFCTYT